MVVSAVNFTEGGPLEILRQFVHAATTGLPSDWKILVLAHQRGLISDPRAKILAIPATKTSWIRRLIFEYAACRRVAARLAPDLWVALHDISPNVGDTPQIVYCHNPAPFFRIRWRDVYLEPSLLLFRLLYSTLYRINIRKNRAIIVQQQWLRDAFEGWVQGSSEIIVSHPGEGPPPESPPQRPPGVGVQRFLYPALPRAFKNFEVIGDALRLLEADGSWHGRVVLTINGDENRYARWFYRKYGDLKSLVFAGRQSRSEMDRQYRSASALIFASRLETWGLPMTEAMGYGLPILAADLPYARETVRDYPQVIFFDPRQSRDLAHSMLSIQAGTARFTGQRATDPAQPFAPDWRTLVRLVVDQHGRSPAGG